MDAVTTLKLQRKQFHIMKPPECGEGGVMEVGVYCLTFNMSDFVRMPMVLSPFVTRTP